MLQFNYQSQNESPLIKLVKESTLGIGNSGAFNGLLNPANKSSAMSTSQDNPLITNESITLGGGIGGGPASSSIMPYEDDGGS